MKTIILSLFTLVTVSSISQVEYLDLNISYDLNSIYPEDSSVTQLIDINQDGTNDLRINSWFGHNGGTFDVIEVVLTNTSYTSGIISNQCMYLKECSEQGASYSSASGYVYNTEQENCILLEGEKSYPFSFLGNNGIHYGSIYVTLNQNTITINGIGFNAIPGQSYFCDQYLNINEIHYDKSNNFNYYNMIGQEVYEKHGVLLQVSDYGKATRKYFE